MGVKILETYPGGTYKARDRRTGKIKYGYRIQIDGKQKWSTKWPTHAEAIKARMARALQPELEELGLVKPVRVTLEELKLAWVADALERELDPAHIRRVEFLLGELRACFRADPYLHEIGIEAVRAFKSRRLASEIHIHTLRTNLTLLKSVFGFALKAWPALKWSPPTVNLPSPLYPSREVALSMDEIKSLLAYLDGPPPNEKKRFIHELVRDFVRVALQTARRESEILQLTRDRVSFAPDEMSDYGSIKFDLKKKKKEGFRKGKEKYRVIPMTADVAAVMRRRAESAKGEKLFGEGPADTLAARVRRGFYSACKQVGIISGYEAGGAVVHTLRHSAATYLSSGEVGLPLPVVIYILGHSGLDMTTKYTHPTAKDMRQAMDALSKLGNGSASATSSTTSTSSLDEPASKVS